MLWCVKYGHTCFAASSIRKWSLFSHLRQRENIQVPEWGLKWPFGFCLCSLRPSTRSSQDAALRPSCQGEAHCEKSIRKTQLIQLPQQHAAQQQGEK